MNQFAKAETERDRLGQAVRRDELLALKMLRDQIAQHCASFFWNDVDIGLLHANWRDAANSAIAKMEDSGLTSQRY